MWLGILVHIPDKLQETRLGNKLNLQSNKNNGPYAEIRLVMLGTLEVVEVI